MFNRTRRHALACSLLIVAALAAACSAPLTPTPFATTPPPPTTVPGPTAAPTAAATTAPTSAPTTAPTAAPTAEPTPEVPVYDDRSTPGDLLASYYNAVNLKDYERAYAYWEDGVSTDILPAYDDFVAGYADTESVLVAGRLPAYPEGAAGSSYAAVPTVLVATHTDGSVHAFTGCYVTRMVNANPEAGWSLYNAGVAPSPDNSTEATLLEDACEELVPGAGTSGRPFESTATPLDLVASYYDAINREDYARAYGYWKTAPNPSLDDFIQGFADTESVLLAVQPPAWIGAAAGTAYGQIPTLLVATHTDGSLHVFVGCFVTSRANVDPEPGWSLYSATLAPTDDNATDVTQLQGACPR